MTLFLPTWLSNGWAQSITLIILSASRRHVPWSQTGSFDNSDRVVISDICMGTFWWLSSLIYDSHLFLRSVWGRSDSWLRYTHISHINHTHISLKSDVAAEPTCLSSSDSLRISPSSSPPPHENHSSHQASYGAKTQTSLPHSDICLVWLVCLP